MVLLGRVSLEKRIERLRRDQGSGTEFDLLQLPLIDQLVDRGAAEPQRLGDLVQFVCFAVQWCFL